MKMCKGSSSMLRRIYSDDLHKHTLGTHPLLNFDLVALIQACSNVSYTGSASIAADDLFHCCPSATRLKARFFWQRPAWIVVVASA